MRSGRQMNDDEDGGGKVFGQAGHEGLERFYSARRSSDDDDVSFWHICRKWLQPQNTSYRMKGTSADDPMLQGIAGQLRSRSQSKLLHDCRLMELDGLD